MKTPHVINLGKPGGVERLFFEYINSERAKSDEILCIENHIGEKIFTQLKNKNINFVNRISSSFSGSKLKYLSFIRKYALKKKIEEADSVEKIINNSYQNFRGNLFPRISNNFQYEKFKNKLNTILLTILHRK
ncbi:MAG: hypothetical protein LBN41_10805 [Enterobacteriaceae bacterium]|jgi:hypothetical protein|nr:hypothetical protein [Enterobacteriaceae bacterium]